MPTVSEQYEIVIGVDTHAAERLLEAGMTLVEPSAMAADRRGIGKSHNLDAVRMAKSVLSVDVGRLRRPRAEGPSRDASSGDRPRTDEQRTYPRCQRVDRTGSYHRARYRCAKAFGKQTD